MLRPPDRNKETFEAGVEQATRISEGSRVRSHKLTHAGLSGVCKDLCFYSESNGGPCGDLNKSLISADLV